jgi:hypothetical protein
MEGSVIVMRESSSSSVVVPDVDVDVVITVVAFLGHPF